MAVLISGENWGSHHRKGDLGRIQQTLKYIHIPAFRMMALGTVILFSRMSEGMAIPAIDAFLLSSSQAFEVGSPWMMAVAANHSGVPAGQ